MLFVFVEPGPATLVVHRFLFNNLIFSTTILILDSFHSFNSLSYHYPIADTCCDVSCWIKILKKIFLPNSCRSSSNSFALVASNSGFFKPGPKTSALISVSSVTKITKKEFLSHDVTNNSLSPKSQIIINSLYYMYI